MHWTQTPNGRKKLSQRMKARHASKLTTSEKVELNQTNKLLANESISLPEAIQYCADKAKFWQDQYEKLVEFKQAFELQR